MKKKSKKNYGTLLTTVSNHCAGGLLIFSGSTPLPSPPPLPYAHILFLLFDSAYGLCDLRNASNSAPILHAKATLE
jgi:hypothetical protein